MAVRRVSHYLLERLLGAGGMGEVHLARDLALGRPTALKLLPYGFDRALRARLLEEARISSRLQHPAIATFYEAGEEDGDAFIAMEFVPGETLRSRLRGGPLPPAEALGLAASLLEGLVHAHALGVLHRDIKPENVMVAGPALGRLLDFGIAKQLPADGTAPGASETALTEAGVVIGTPGYVAPELLRGDPADARSDLFAVGALLHESLAGRRLFDGANASERMARVLTAEPPALEGQGAPRGTDALLARALAKNPSDRFDSAAAFLLALQDVVAGGRASATPDTVAVVDLENASADPADAWIGSAVAEQLTGDLARVVGLQVIARERVLRSAGGVAAGAGAGGSHASAPDALERARALGCRWLLSGSFQRSGPALRLSTRLTEVPTARVIRSERLDGTVAEIFALQDRLAAAVVRSFPLDLAALAARTAETPQIGAYELYATGKRLFQRLQKGTFADAKRQFERAIELDPRFAPPHSGLAAIHAMHFTYMTDTKELELAEAYARRSIELDATHGDAYSWLA
ncbi:MAG TPA: protein kinase, partial [Candidatus Eisenbacteria bacterium]|nr:protein kinase [Candidatus Eisenbacteria bacterium]